MSTKGVGDETVNRFVTSVAVTSVDMKEKSKIYTVTRPIFFPVVTRA